MPAPKVPNTVNATLRRQENAMRARREKMAAELRGLGYVVVSPEDAELMPRERAVQVAVGQLAGLLDRFERDAAGVREVMATLVQIQAGVGRLRAALTVPG